MAFTEDRTAFYSDFGVSAVVGGVACAALFDAPAADVLGIAGTRPSLLVEASVGAEYGDAVTVGAASYTVAELQPDGTGMTRLILEAV